MNIVSQTPPAMMAPLHSLLRWLLPSAAKSLRPRVAPPSQRVGAAPPVARAQAPWMTAGTMANQSRAAVRRPLRVVRFLEAGQTPAEVGRMVITGHMSDVCAELDRLAAREAALH